MILFIEYLLSGVLFISVLLFLLLVVEHLLNLAYTQLECIIVFTIAFGICCLIGHPLFFP